MPFYWNVIVPMSLMYSWMLAYQKIDDKVTGKSIQDEDLPQNRKKLRFVRSIDHLISDSVANPEKELEKEFTLWLRIIALACLSKFLMIFFPKLLTMDIHNDLDFLLDLLLFC